MARMFGQSKKQQEGQAPGQSFSARFDQIGKGLGIMAAALLIACLLAQTALQSSAVRHLLSGAERMEGTRLKGQVSS
ncbi:hypothetical protein [Paenibacillus sp. FSL H8-0537]|uniref:hypothetical protein n=1 Tax=Paenibacillus sp. FSL H8-0537 TaxID=2921399 RepID=UPI003100DBC8